MAVQTVTLSLPENVYEQIRRAAEISRRSVDEVMTEAVAAVAPVTANATQEMRSTLAQMAYMNDAALWRAARATMPTEQRERLAALHDEQQRTPLTPEERSEEQALLRLYRETILVRAQAAVILRQRGYEVSDPEQFAPLQ